MPRPSGEVAVRTCPMCGEAVDRITEFGDGSAEAEPCECEFEDVDDLVEKEVLI